MKKLVVVASVFLSINWGFAQANLPTAEEKDLMTWYHKDFSTTNVYGVNTENAYKFLESKGLKPQTIVVGVLDSGVEVDHPGLIGNLWKNPNEVPGNGKDDDGNGYIDDVHGWNFIGGKNGDIDIDNLEVTRVVKKYQSIFEGEAAAKNKEKMPEEYEMYSKAKKIYDKKSTEGGAQQAAFYRQLLEKVPSFVAILNGKNLTPENLASIKPTTPEQAMGLQVLSQLAQDPGYKGKTPPALQEALTKEFEGAVKHFESEVKQYDLNFDPRQEIVGDNYEDYSERFYGNNHYEGPDAQHGTHVAGIIAGLPNGKEVQKGVAYKVAKIMTVRTVPNGDERDKDVANSIRYAVDNGAKILNMSFGKPVSPGMKHVWEAFKYAESKGVLLVKAAGNENEDIAEHLYYPTNFKNVTDDKPFLNNMIIVGASTNNNDGLRAGFSNYNKKMVDVFAPGEQIYSTVPDGKYEYLQGTSMASPVVAGAAAVLWAYMPTLTPEQIIESFVNTVNKSTDGFAKFSRSGGVIDVKKAAEYAYNNFYSKSNSSKIKEGAKKLKTSK